MDSAFNCHSSIIKLDTNQEYILPAPREGWENEFDRVKVLHIFVLSKIVWETTTCDTIEKYNMILKRIDLSLLDLQNKNWVIKYPPS